MPRTASVRKYGKQPRKPKAEMLFSELPQTPAKRKPSSGDILDQLTVQLTSMSLASIGHEPDSEIGEDSVVAIAEQLSALQPFEESDVSRSPERSFGAGDQDLRILTWADVCPPGDRIEKIAEASYAEVYRVKNERGTSIIKVIRLDSPIRPQTKAQERSGLVDEEPHSENDLLGELKISEWLAEIPGFVVYKERYIVKGKASKDLLETHQTFHRKAKRRDPGRLQFYPSPSRYLDDTKFLVVELGDAGIALEDFALVSSTQLWDIFLHLAIALARAEDQFSFEHRDLHEGNLCIRQTGSPIDREANSRLYFGYSGLEITILDYGLSRAESDSADNTSPVAYDLEKELSIFTSTHAPQCKVYRQMRSFLLKGDRFHLPPEFHHTPYESGPDGPISWNDYHPYTNVLWLAYIYDYLTRNFEGEKKELAKFRRVTKEFWSHLNPEAASDILSFSSATDVIHYAVDAGWVSEEQLMGYRESGIWAEVGDESCNESIIEAQIVERDESELRRSPRRRQTRVVH